MIRKDSNRNTKAPYKLLLRLQNLAQIPRSSVEYSASFFQQSLPLLCSPSTHSAHPIQSFTRIPEVPEGRDYFYSFLHCEHLAQCLKHSRPSEFVEKIKTVGLHAMRCVKRAEAAEGFSRTCTVAALEAEGFTTKSHAKARNGRPDVS